MLIIVQKNGKYYASGIEFDSFREALKFIWNK